MLILIQYNFLDSVHQNKCDTTSYPFSFDFTADQLPGAADQTHPQLPAHLQDAVTLRLVGRLRVAAHPVPAAQSPRAQIFLGL